MRVPCLHCGLRSPASRVETAARSCSPRNVGEGAVRSGPPRLAGKVAPREGPCGPSVKESRLWHGGEGAGTAWSSQRPMVAGVEIAARNATERVPGLRGPQASSPASGGTATAATARRPASATSWDFRLHTLKQDNEIKQPEGASHGNLKLSRAYSIADEEA